VVASATRSGGRWQGVLYESVANVSKQNPHSQPLETCEWRHHLTSAHASVSLFYAGCLRRCRLGRVLELDMDTRIRWLRSEWPTSTTMLEIPIYLLVVGAMGLVAVHSYVYAQRHLHVMEALSVMTGPRVTMMEYRAVTGTWPTSNGQSGFSDAIFKENDHELYRVNSVQIREGGAIEVKFSRGVLKEKVVSVRASEQPGPGLPVEWTCGRARTLPGTTATTDRTTITDNDLPSPCRAHR